MGTELREYFKRIGQPYKRVTRSRSVCDQLREFEKEAKDDGHKEILLVHAGSATPRNCPPREIMTSNRLIAQEINEFRGKAKMRIDILNISSISVYDFSQGVRVVREDTLKTAGSEYARSKIEIEELLYIGSNKNSSLLTIRCPGILGYGSWYTGNFLSVTGERLARGKEITIRNPECLFNNAIHAETIGEIAAEYRFHRWPGACKTVNVGAKTEMRIGEIIDFIKIRIDSKSAIRVESKTGGNFHLDCTEASRAGIRLLDMQKTLELFCKDLTRLMI